METKIFRALILFGKKWFANTGGQSENRTLLSTLQKSCITTMLKDRALFGKKSFANTVNILYTYLLILSMGKSPMMAPNKIMNIISMKLLY